MSDGRKSIDSVSHGRGGAGNIGADSTPYVDGEIVREGAAGDHGDGAFSTGRGGAANIGSPGLAATKRNDKESIPDVALRASEDNVDHHVGRGGGGNVHIAKPEKPTSHTGLADKLKNKLFKSKGTKAETTAETTTAAT